jgi:uncharacterized protein (TIGR00251 family)
VEFDRSDLSLSSVCRQQSDHIRLSVRLTPNGGRDALDGVEYACDGNIFLKARVSAAPEDGKANKALMQLLSKMLRIPKSSIAIVSGETARKKILRIDGDPEDLKQRLQKRFES